MNFFRLFFNSPFVIIHPSSKLWNQHQKIPIISLTRKPKRNHGFWLGNFALVFRGFNFQNGGLSQVPGPYHFPSTKVKSWRSFLSSEHRRMVDEFQVRAGFLGGLVVWGSNFRSRFSQWVVVSGPDLVKCNSNYLVGGFKCFFFFLCSPLFWVEDSHFEILTHIFQRGWFNHQPVQIQIFFPVVNLLVGFGHAMIMGSRCSNSTIESVWATLRGWAPDPVIYGVK